MTHYSIPDDIPKTEHWAEMLKENRDLHRQKRQKEAEVFTEMLRQASKERSDVQRHYALNEYVKKVAATAEPCSPLTKDRLFEEVRTMRTLRRCATCRAVVADEDIEAHAIWHENESERLLAVALDMVRVLANLDG